MQPMRQIFIYRIAPSCTRNERTGQIERGKRESETWPNCHRLAANNRHLPKSFDFDLNISHFSSKLYYFSLNFHFSVVFHSVYMSCCWSVIKSIDWYAVDDSRDELTIIISLSIVSRHLSSLSVRFHFYSISGDRLPLSVQFWICFAWIFVWELAKTAEKSGLGIENSSGVCAIWVWLDWFER